MFFFFFLDVQLSCPQLREAGVIKRKTKLDKCGIIYLHNKEYRCRL